MARETVYCTGETLASPDDVWAMAGTFVAPWHPLVAWMEQEQTGDGQIIRRFAAKSDDALMREQLTYLSHSDHVMAYTALQGIDGANHYAARFSVSPSGEGSRITWQADIDAAPARAKEIAQGTAVVFDAGIATLSTPAPMPVASPTPPSPSPLGKLAIGQSPKLGLTVAPAGLGQTKTLCLCLHGIGGNRSNWDSQLMALGGLMPMVAMDLRGYGDSTLGDEPSQTGDYFDDILTVMAHFGVEKLVLCGLSYGAWIATSFALRHPDKVAGLVLCGGCTGMSEAIADKRDAFRASREVPLNAGKSPADFAGSVVDIIAGPDASDTVRQALFDSMAAIRAETYRDALTCFTNPPGPLDFTQAGFPVLMMTGEHDRLAPPDEIRTVSHRFAQSAAPFVQFEMIAGAGHVCNLENPKAVNDHLTAFLGLFASTPEPGVTGKSARKQAKRARILDAALVEFSRNGYSGASMQAIADRAEVSKPTLYHYIGQKEDMFRTILEAGRDEILSAFEHADTCNMADVLWEFSWTYADYVLDPDNLSIARLMIAEAQRVPDIVRKFNDTGPARAQAGIAAYLDTQRGAGRLRFDDSTLAAEHLWALVLSGPRNAALYFPDSLPDDSMLSPVILAGLQTFLRAYATEPALHLTALTALSAHRPPRRA